MKRNLCAMLLCLLASFSCMSFAEGELFSDHPDATLQQRGDEVFYFNGYSLYRMNADGAGVALLAKSNCTGDLNVTDDALYAVSGLSSGEGIFRFSKDGTGDPEQLFSHYVIDMRVLEDQLYFLWDDRKDDLGYAAQLYRQGMDGTGLERLSDKSYRRFDLIEDTAVAAYDLPVKDGALVIGIDVISLATGEMSALLPDCEYRFVQDGYLYYVKRIVKEEGIWRVRPDGTGLEQMPDSAGLQSPCPGGDWFYYHNDDNRVVTSELRNVRGAGTPVGSIYRRNFEGDTIEMLYEGNCQKVEVSGDWIAFEQFDNAEGEYRRCLVRTDGTGFVMLEKE